MKELTEALRMPALGAQGRIQRLGLFLNFLQHDGHTHILARPTDSQARRSFIKIQAKAIWTCDIFVLHPVGFHVL